MSSGIYGPSLSSSAEVHLQAHGTPLLIFKAVFQYVSFPLINVPAYFSAHCRMYNFEWASLSTELFSA